MKQLVPQEWFALFGYFVVVGGLGLSGVGVYLATLLPFDSATVRRSEPLPEPLPFCQDPPPGPRGRRPGLQQPERDGGVRADPMLHEPGAPLPGTAPKE